MIEKITLRPKTPQLDATQLIDLLDTYLDSLRSRVSRHTHESFCRKTNYFRRFWSDRGASYNYILTPIVLRDFGDYLDSLHNERTNEPLSWNTKNDAMRRLRSLLRWSWRNEYLSSDWSQHVPAPRGQAHSHSALSLVDLRAIFDQCFMSDQQIRDTALLALYAGTGARRAEIANILTGDVRFVDGLSGLITLKVTKNSRQRQIAFDSVAGRYLRMYLDRTQPERFLFPGKFSGTALGDETIGRIFRRHADAAGVTEFSGCHDFRRTFATLWILRLPGEGYDSMLQRQLGHTTSNSMTYGLYNKLTAEDIRRVMDIKRVSAFAQMLA